MTELSDSPTFSMRGGALCLDFANQLHLEGDQAGSRSLDRYMVLVSWGVQAGVVTAEQGQDLVRVAEGRPTEVARVLAETVALRGAVDRLFRAIAEARAPQEEDLATLNAALGSALAHLRVTSSGGGFTLAWADEVGALDRILWPVARSAADLLTTGELERVRQCAGESCRWLFVDRSRNHSRRWCDMQQCGNVAKVRRYRRRQRTADQDGEPTPQ